MIKFFLKKVIQLVNVIILKINGVQYGKNLRINGLIKIKGQGEIVIGDNVTISSGLYINPIGGFSRTMLNTYGGGQINIGNNVGISNSILVSKVKITIGDGALIGGGTLIIDSDFHSLDWRIRNTPDDVSKDIEVTIGKNAFVGAFSILTKGSIVADREIVPAGFHGRFSGK